MRKVIRYFIGQKLAVNMLTVLILGTGTFYAFKLQREVFPNVDFDVVNVSTVWVGASAIDVERIITNEIEDNIKEVSGLEEYRSESLEGLSIVTATIDPDEKDPDRVIRDLRSSVDKIENLPEDVDRPIFTEIRSDLTPIIEWALIRVPDESDRMLISYEQLRNAAEQLEDKFLTISEVASVTRLGWRDREIIVDINPYKMRNYTVGSNDIIRTLRDRNISLPGGDVLSGNTESTIRTVAEFNDAQEIARTPIRVNDIGSNLRIESIAEVYDDFEEPDYLISTENYQSINLTVQKKRSADTIRLSDKTKEIVKDFSKKLPPGIEIRKVFDYSFFVKRRLNLLTTNLFQGAFLVFIILIYFLGWRFASFTALSIPFSFTLVFIILNFIDSSLNLLTLFGLIMVSGMLTDPAIVVSENIVRLREKGKSLRESIEVGASEVFAPIMTTINTTLATFAPLMFMTGIFGKFVAEIPYVIVIGVVASLFPAFIILTVNSLKEKKKKGKKIEITDESNEENMFKESETLKKFRDVYFRRFMTMILTYRKTSLLLMFVLFAGSIPAYILFGSFKLFPNQIDSLSVKVEAPIGSPQELTNRFLLTIGQYIRQIPESEVDTFTSRAGIQTAGPADPFTKRGNHYGQMTVHLYPEADRELDILEIINDLKGKAGWMLADPRRKADVDVSKDPIRARNMDLVGGLTTLTVSRLQGGPPVGRAIGIELVSDNLFELKKVAAEYKRLLLNIDGLFDVNDDITEGKKEYRVYIDDMKTVQTQLTAFDIASGINTSYEGSIATSIRRQNEEIDIRVRYAEKYQNGKIELDKVFVTNRLGNMISLGNVTNLDFGDSVASIKHLDGKRMINVFSDLDDKVISPTKAAKIIDELDDEIVSAYPDVLVNFAGENEDTAESLESLGQMSILGFFIIFFLLAILFRSTLQPFIILTSVLFASAGVIYAFLLHGLPLSFLSLIGVIGLAGVVVNDPIVLTDFANQIRRENPKLASKEVALQAGLTRLRPNFLTSSTTIAGLIPTAYGIGGGDPFLIPTALAFCWGLIVATIMSLFFHPLLIYYEYQFRAFTEKIKRRLSVSMRQLKKKVRFKKVSLKKSTR